MENKQQEMTVILRRGKVAKVSGFKEASEQVCRSVGHDGSRAWSSQQAKYGAGLIRIDGTPVAFVSYNGRVWKVTLPWQDVVHFNSYFPHEEIPV